MPRRALRDAVRLEPSSLNDSILATVLAQEHKYGEAIQALQAGLRSEPNSLDLRLTLAQMLPPPQSTDYLRQITAVGRQPGGAGPRHRQHHRIQFAIADAGVADAATDPAQARLYYQRAARLLESYADEGGTTNVQRQVLIGDHPNPALDNQMRRLYAHVMGRLVALAPPDERPALQAAAQEYDKKYAAVFAESRTIGYTTSQSPCFSRRKSFHMDITVTPRPKRTKGERKQRLRQGLVPAAIYGRGIEPSLVEVPARAIADVLQADTGLNTLINLTVQGDNKTHAVMIDNLERDRITRGFLNVGFHQVKKGDKVHAQIPINVVGVPQDVALNGALLEQTLDSIDVHAQPGDLPAHLDVDVSQMKIGDVLRVADLPHNPKVEFTTHEDAAIVAVHVSKTAQQAEEDAAAAEVPAGADAVTELRADADAKSDSITGTDSQA